jgi:hypothetical protein
MIPMHSIYTNIPPEKLKAHEAKVENIIQQIQDKIISNEPITIQKQSVSHTVPGADRGKSNAKKIDVKSLSEILLVDPAIKIGVAESGVTFSNLVKETLKYNLIPMCVSELKDITIGGAVAGCSVESMSYKYGGFHDSCVAYEIITGKAQKIICSNEENADIFHMVHGTFGTLGIISLLRFTLIPAKPFVRMDYIHYSNLSEYLAAIQYHYEKKDVELMDGIIHSNTDYVLCIGTMVDSAPYQNEYVWAPFYKSTETRKHDYIPIYDYFFRYDADCHWISRNYMLDNYFIRSLVWPWTLGSRKMISLAQNYPILSKIFPQSNGPEVVVDVFIPISKMKYFYQWYLKEFNYYPVWIVPYFIKKPYPWINPKHVEGISDQLYIDFAIYGFKQPSDGRNYYKILEDKVKEVSGIKTLITHNYYNEKAFWEIHDQKQYDEVKKKVDPKNLFRNLFTKMVH